MLSHDIDINVGNFVTLRSYIDYVLRIHILIATLKIVK